MNQKITSQSAAFHLGLAMGKLQKLKDEWNSPSGPSDDFIEILDALSLTAHYFYSEDSEKSFSKPGDIPTLEESERL